jgi:hypothetical protein
MTLTHSPGTEADPAPQVAVPPRENHIGKWLTQP